MDAHRRARSLRWLLAAMFLARVASARDSAVPTEPLIRFAGIRGPGFDVAVAGAVSDALERLRDSRCRQIFTDFRDAEGRTLQERLDSLGASPASFLRSLFVFDADHEKPCQAARVLAGTRPGSRVLAFCGAQFFRLRLRNPSFAAATVLHEALHSLGLGENPPSSAEITERVLARCGK